MPHFKCAVCSTSLYSAASAASLVSDACPECGSAVQSIGERAEAIDAAAITIRAGAAAVAAPIVRESVGDRIGHVIARREVIRAQLRFDAERWADAGSR